MTRTHKALIVFAVCLSVGGCATAEQKALAYRNVADKFANPEKLKICYSREGDITRGIEYRCFGEGCELPPCPG